MTKEGRKLKVLRSSWRIKEDGKWGQIDPEGSYDFEFIKELNSLSLKSPLSDYVNELFLYYFVKRKEIEKAIGGVDSASFTFGARLSDKGAIYALNRNAGRPMGCTQTTSFYIQVIISLLFSITLSVSLSLFLPFLFLLKAKRNCGGVKNNKVFGNSVFLVRSSSGFSRMKGFVGECDGSVVLVDDHSGLKVNGSSIYGVLWSLYFPSIYIRSLYYTIRDFSALLRDASQILGFWHAFSVCWDYWARVSQKCLYEACFLKVLDLLPKSAEVYSSDKEDRFALMQTRCCTAKNFKLTCLPHGLEYGFRFPGGLCGTEFYCFSENAKNILQHLYPSKSFLYSDRVLNKMLGINDQISKDSVDRVCFFTEPREQSVNLEIIKKLVEHNLKFSIKLHPLEDSLFYKEKYPDIDIIDDLEEALRSSTCLARKSTVLVEASQRGRRSIAVLVNRKDRFYVDHLFPSLSSEKIVKAVNFEGLFELL